MLGVVAAVIMFVVVMCLRGSVTTVVRKTAMLGIVVPVVVEVISVVVSETISSK